MTTRRLSTRSSLLRPSPTLALNARVAEMRRAGEKVISFAAGEPDFATPRFICEAAERAMADGQTHYTASSGTPELKAAILARFQAASGVEADPSQVVVSCGAKHSVANALMVLVEPGDEVVLVAPYWMTYRDQVVLAGGEPRVVHARREDGFVPRPEAIAEAITPGTRVIVVNSPGNPTGAVWPREVLEAIAALAERHDLWIVSDEIYERLLYGACHVSPASLSRSIAERTVTVNGCSKAYAMTGWRIGWSIAPAPVAKAMSALQDQVTSNPTSFAQAGAVTALERGEAEVARMLATFSSRRATMLQGLRSFPGIELAEPQGAFYVFAGVDRFLGEGCGDDAALADHLLAEAQVAAIPGSVFEGPGHLRLSFATDEESIREGCRRLGTALALRYDS